MYVPPLNVSESRINPLDGAVSEEEAKVQICPDVKDTALRRKILADLTEIGQALQHKTDKLPSLLRLWQSEFLDVMKTPHVNEELALANFIQHLKNILVDPLTLEPLGEDALLGSDGHIYDRISLSVYLSSIPEEMRKRSPLDAKNPKPFITYEHPALKKMAEWLKKNEVSRPRSEPLLKRYQELKDLKQKVKIPTEQSEKEKRIFARALQIKQRQAELKKRKVMGLIAGEEKIQRQFEAAHLKNPLERLSQLEEKTSQIEKKLQDQPLEELTQFWQELRNENEKRLDQELLIPGNELEEARKEFLAFEARLHQRKAKLHERLNELEEQFEALKNETKASFQSQFGDPANERSALSEKDLAELRQKEIFREKDREEQIQAFNQRLEALEANTLQQHQKFDLMSQQIKEDLTNNHLLIENMSSKDVIRHCELKGEIEDLNRKLHQAELMDSQIKQELLIVNQKIQEHQLGNEQLQLANQKLKKAIHKSRTGWKDALVAVGSIVLSYGLTELYQAATATQGALNATPSSFNFGLRFNI